MAEKNEQMLRVKGNEDLEPLAIMQLLREADCLDVLLIEANEIYAGQDLVRAFEMLKKIKDLMSLRFVQITHHRRDIFVPTFTENFSDAHVRVAAQEFT